MRTATKKSSIPASIEKYIGNTWGTPAPGGQVSIDTPNHISQRAYKKQNVYKYIAKVKGLDWNLFGYVTAIKRKSDGQLALINGQHRIGVVKIISPSTTHVPAHIIDVDDTAFDSYGGTLFSQFNGEVSKTLTNEELFHSQVIAGDPHALYVKSILIKCGLSCGQVNQDPKNYPVVYATFNKCLKISEEATIRSVELQKKGFRGVADDPLHGFVFLLGHPVFKHLGDPTTTLGKDFEKWITEAVPMFHGLSDLKFKKYRANSNWSKGIAYGLLKSFAKFQRNHSRTMPTKISVMKKIYEDGFKKTDDSGLLE